MSYYNQITHAEAKHLPTNLLNDVGVTTNPTKAQLQAAGWLLHPIVPFTTPEGYVRKAGTRRIVVADNIPSEEWDVWTTDEAESARIATLVPIYGTKVGQFAGLLAVFGLAMPIEEDEASAAMYATVKADVNKTADSQLTMAIYNNLRKNLSNDDIYGIGKAIGVAE